VSPGCFVRTSSFGSFAACGAPYDKVFEVLFHSNKVSVVEVAIYTLKSSEHHSNTCRRRQNWNASISDHCTPAGYGLLAVEDPHLAPIHLIHGPPPSLASQESVASKFANYFVAKALGPARWQYMCVERLNRTEKLLNPRTC